MKETEMREMWCEDCEEIFGIYDKLKCCPYCGEQKFKTLAKKRDELNKRIKELNEKVKLRN